MNKKLLLFGALTALMTGKIAAWDVTITNYTQYAVTGKVYSGFSIFPDSFQLAGRNVNDFSQLPPSTVVSTSNGACFRSKISGSYVDATIETANGSQSDNTHTTNTCRDHNVAIRIKDGKLWVGTED